MYFEFRYLYTIAVILQYTSLAGRKPPPTDRHTHTIDNGHLNVINNSLQYKRKTWKVLKFLLKCFILLDNIWKCIMVQLRRLKCKQTTLKRKSIILVEQSNGCRSST